MRLHDITYGTRSIYLWEIKQVPRRRPCRPVTTGWPRPLRPTARNHVWAYDFVFDTCANWQTLKCLTIVNEWTRECRAIDLAGSIRSGRVIEVLAQPFIDWCADHRVAIHDIHPGKPGQIAYIERFNRSYRTEVCNAHLFELIAELQALTITWLRLYTLASTANHAEWSDAASAHPALARWRPQRHGNRQTVAGQWGDGAPLVPSLRCRRARRIERGPTETLASARRAGSHAGSGVLSDLESRHQRLQESGFGTPDRNRTPNGLQPVDSPRRSPGDFAILSRVSDREYRAMQRSVLGTSPVSIQKKKLLTVVVISIGIGALTTVAGYFLGLSSAANGGVTGAICGTTAVLILRQPSQ